METNTMQNIKTHFGAYEKTISSWLEKIDKLSMVKRLWAKDTSLWTKDPKGQEEIKSRLGWLTIADEMKGKVKELKSFSEEIKSAGFTHILLLGMGGSSLAPEVFQKTFGNQAGYPELLVLDSTDPEQVSDVEKSINLEKTLFIVSSKSGDTIELVSFFKYFFEKLKAAKGESAGEQFVAITDPDTALEKLAKEKKFRKIFLSSPDVGGRFSALTYFGLVPASLIGVDVQKILAGAQEMMKLTSGDVTAHENAAASLGTAMAILAESGRDKLTILCSPALESFGDWAEQLIAESSGKEELGIVPVVHESLERPGLYEDDRFFAALLLEDDHDLMLEKKIEKLTDAGNPVLIIKLKEKADLGGEFFRWEMATAIACALLKVNAFDQPDVQSAKERAKTLLKKIEAGESIAIPRQDASIDEFWENLSEGDYIGILAFLPYREPLKEKLFGLRSKLKELTKKAVTVGFGPRYLHSTGQLHKGGANNGAFILITTKHADNLPIPGDKFGFAELELAQAIGDFEALQEKGRRVLHFELNAPMEEELDNLIASLTNAIRSKE